MLNETVIFRATDELSEAIQHCASEAQLTVSEYLRSIISDCVGVREVISPTCADIASAAFFHGEPSPHQNALARKPLVEGFADPDPFALMAYAAEGDVRAQRELADMAILLALSGVGEVDPSTTLSEGLVLARLAECHGGIEDAMRVVTMLALASTLAADQAARDLAAEAIARLEIIADGASCHAECAAQQLASHAQREQPETMRLAQDYRERLSSHCRAVTQSARM